MTPDKALNLVKRYAFLTHAIKGCKTRIGECLSQCRGLKGHRLDVIKRPAFDGGDLVGPIEAYEEPTREAQNDQETHLSVWYSKDYGEWGEYEFVRFGIGDGDEEEDCPHCFAAHKVVEERKELRRQLSYIKGAMTKTYDGTLPSAL